MAYKYIFLFLSIFVSLQPWQFLKGELGLVEILQVLIILYVIILSFLYKNIICNYNLKFIFWIKQILLFSLLYEEISFLTANIHPFLEYINKQNEFNIHNSKIWLYTFHRFYIFPNDSIDINIGLIISIAAPLLWGFGSYIKTLKKFRYIFLDKSFSFLCLIYPMHITLSYFNRNLFLSSSDYILSQESIELILYLILLFDMQKKITLYKSKLKFNKFKK